jgi:hypothetical protein
MSNVFDDLHEQVQLEALLTILAGKGFEVTVEDGKVSAVNGEMEVYVERSRQHWFARCPVCLVSVLGFPPSAGAYERDYAFSETALLMIKRAIEALEKQHA